MNKEIKQFQILTVQILITLLTFLISSCGKDFNNPTVESDINMNKKLSYEEMIAAIDEDLLAQAVEQPDANGALSRNKDGYFSVRFQTNMTKLIDLAITAERIDALNEYLNTIKYSLNYQNPDGSFQLNPPVELINDPSISLPGKGDSVSAVAFFSYALGISLNALNESTWYNTSEAASFVRDQITSFSPNFEKTLIYLINNQSILKQVDGQAPNRLIFDAIAFYGLGKYLGNSEAQSIGIEFLNLALNFIDQDEGYFIEKGGWDSSYNGVAIKLGMELFSMLSADKHVKSQLEEALIGATLWQKSRILSSGEISTEGNTRVFPGGESFLGNEKDVDVEKTIRAFYYFSKLTEKNEFKELADRILNNYR